MNIGEELMQHYSGGCHCGAVRFNIEADLSQVLDCNCSICQKKGALHHRIGQNQFKLISGEDQLTLYQFNKKVAKHYFCKNCGIHSFSHPRSAPEKISVNIRCLDNIKLTDYPTTPLDGKNWEQAIAELIKTD